MIPHLHLLYLITQTWKSQLPASIFYSHVNSPQTEPLCVSATLVCRLLFMGWSVAHVTDFPLSVPHVSYLRPSETCSLSYRDPEMDGFSTSVASAWSLAWLVATFLWFLHFPCPATSCSQYSHLRILLNARRLCQASAPKPLEIWPVSVKGRIPAVAWRPHVVCFSSSCFSRVYDLVSPLHGLFPSVPPTLASVVPRSPGEIHPVPSLPWLFSQMSPSQQDWPSV